MNLHEIDAQMDRNAQVIRALVRDKTDEQARWKPTPDTWSILEVIHHLYDEEREDFRTRLDYTLHQPGKPWPEIDPQEWVVARKYNQQYYHSTLTNYLQEREHSRRWLLGLTHPNWDLAYNAPFGLLTARDLLAAWVAHDLLHIRQLVELTWADTTRRLSPYKVAYAGPW